MKFNVEKLKEIARPMNAEEQAAMDFRSENADWLRLSAQIALKIRKVIRQKGMSQAQLASELGVTPAQVSKYLSGKINFELKTIAKFQSVLGESIMEINLSDKPKNFAEQRLKTQVLVVAYSDKSNPVTSYPQIGTESYFSKFKILG